MEKAPRKKDARFVQGVMILILSLCMLMPISSYADVFWNGGNGNWSDTTKWDQARMPNASDDTTNLNTSGTVNYDISSSPQLNTLSIDNSMTLQQSQGDLTTNREYVGLQGSGSISQTGGNNIINGDSSTYEGGCLFLGYENGSSGTYDLMGGNLSAFQITVGRSVRTEGYVGPLNGSIGTFTQDNNSTLTIGQDLVLGQGDGSTGTYTLQSGTINGGRDEYIGGQGTGIFIQNGGLNKVTHILDVGFQPTTQGGSGSYTLNNDGRVEAAYLLVGSGGATGTFTQNGGAVSVTLPPSAGDPTTINLRVGNTTGSTGTYTLNNGNLTVGNASTNNGLETIGRQNGSMGTFNQTGGTHTLNGVMIIGELPGSTGAYNLSGGILTVNGGATPPTEVLQYTGALLNNGQLNITNNAEATFSGSSTNNGTIHVTNATATFDGTFTNNGAYISDPSINRFLEDLVVGPDGYLQAMAGDQFIISGDFINNSTSDLWDTTEALLGFTGTVNHNVTGDSSWSILQFYDSLTLSGTGSLFFNSLQMGEGVNITISGLSLYSDNPDLIGMNIGGVTVESQAPVPEPTTIFLLGSGLLGFAGFRKKMKK